MFYDTCLFIVVCTDIGYRQVNRPAEPKDLDFDLEGRFIPDPVFTKGDLTLDTGARHLVFGTDYQLSLLARARTW